MNFKTKLLKAKHILNFFFQGKNQINSIYKINHPALTIVADTILQVKNREFSKEDKQVFENLDKFRNELALSNEIIDYKIFNTDETRVVHDVFRRAASPETWCKFLYLLTKNLNVKNCLEIGTNLGVSGSYILSALKKHSDCSFITMEGAPKLCSIAGNQFRTIASENQFRIFQGLYENTFPEVLNLPLDFEICFIDGNHQLEPTLYYFKKLKEKSANPCVFLFDDIYWSEGMIKAWESIKNDPDVNFTINLFKMGIVIIDKSNRQKNLTFNYYLDKIL